MDSFLFVGSSDGPDILLGSLRDKDAANDALKMSCEHEKLCKDGNN